VVACISPLLGDVYFVKPKGLCNCVANRFFAAQNHVQVSPINVVVLRKCDLTSLAFNCGSQQMNEVIIAKHKSVPTQTAGEGKCTSFVIGLGRHGVTPRPKTQTPIRAEKSRPTAATPRECVPNRSTATYPLVTTGGGALPLP
jgi:hypothetical protein